MEGGCPGAIDGGGWRHHPSGNAPAAGRQFFGRGPPSAKESCTRTQALARAHTTQNYCTLRPTASDRLTEGPRE